MDTIEAFSKWTFNRPVRETLATAYAHEYDRGNPYFEEKAAAVRKDAAAWYCTLDSESKARVLAAVEAYRLQQVGLRARGAR